MISGETRGGDSTRYYIQPSVAAAFAALFSACSSFFRILLTSISTSHISLSTVTIRGTISSTTALKLLCVRRRAEGTRIPNQFKGSQEEGDGVVSFEVAGSEEGASKSVGEGDLSTFFEEGPAGDSE